MNNENDIKFNDLVFKALDHSVDSISEGGVLVPFVMTPTNISRFVSEKIEDAKAKAECYMESKNDEPLIVLAYDGFVVVDDNKSDAVFVVGIDRIRRKKLVLAQRYNKATSSNSFEINGNPILIEQKDL